jgi:hypothetical protein
MGGRKVPEVMQRICEYIAAVPTSLKDRVRMRVHIDNIRCVGDKAACEEMLAIVRARAERYNATFKEELDPSIVKTRTEFGGIISDYTAKTIELSEKFRRKLDRVMDLQYASHREVLHGFGVLMYIGRAMQHRASPYFDVFKYARATAKAITKGENIDAVRQAP